VTAADEPRFSHDPSVPALPRVYDYAMGGKDNYAADRAVAQEIMDLAPGAEKIARQNRDFIDRAIRYAAGQGIGQFLDIGAGMPLPPPFLNTHETADRHHPGTRTVYADKDPLVVVHQRAMLGEPPQVAAMDGDLKDPRAIMGSPVLTGCIDLSLPVAVILGAVLHFLPGPEAFDAVEVIREAVSPGSYLIVSHATADEADEKTAAAIRDKYAEKLDPITFRTRGEVMRFSEGWELAEPGVVGITEWRPGAEEKAPLALYALVARKPPDPFTTRQDTAVARDH
jgi:hypothetical protein